MSSGISNIIRHAAEYLREHIMWVLVILLLIVLVCCLFNKFRPVVTHIAKRIKEIILSRTGKRIIGSAVLCFLGFYVFLSLSNPLTNSYNKLNERLRDNYGTYVKGVREDKKNNCLVITLGTNRISVGPGFVDSTLTDEELEDLYRTQFEIVSALNSEKTFGYLRRRYSILRRSEDMYIQTYFTEKTGPANLIDIDYMYFTSGYYSGTEWFTGKNQKNQKWYFSSDPGPSEDFINPKYIYYDEILTQYEETLERVTKPDFFN